MRARLLGPGQSYRGNLTAEKGGGVCRIAIYDARASEPDMDSGGSARCSQLLRVRSSAHHSKLALLLVYSIASPDAASTMLDGREAVALDCRN